MGFVLIRSLEVSKCAAKKLMSSLASAMFLTLPINERADRLRRAGKRRGLNNLIDTGLTISGDLGEFVIDSDR